MAHHILFDSQGFKQVLWKKTPFRSPAHCSPSIQKNDKKGIRAGFLWSCFLFTEKSWRPRLSGGHSFPVGFYNSSRSRATKSFPIWDGCDSSVTTADSLLEKGRKRTAPQSLASFCAREANFNGSPVLWVLWVLAPLSRFLLIDQL